MIYFSFFILFCCYYFQEEITEYLEQLYKFMEFIHERNPLLLTYYDDDCLEFYYKTNDDEDEDDEDQQDENKEKEKDKDQQTTKSVELYENKYLEKFKKFTSEYYFNSYDNQYMDDTFKKLVDKHYNIDIPKLEKSIEEMNLKIEKSKERMEIERKSFNEYYPDFDLNLLNEWDGHTKYSDEIWDDYYDYDNARSEVIRQQIQLEKAKNDLQCLLIKTDFKVHQDAKEQSYEEMLNNKLNHFIDNYIIEFTPLGNVIMRYNHNKQSFEYFSDHSVPYRYLEPIGRKYVMTYRCKAIFIDMDEEVEKANKLNEIKMKEMKEMKENGMKNKMNKNLINKPHSLTNKKIDMPPNRNGQTIINPINDVDIAVKNANRYTWEGRLLDFKCIKTEKYRNVHKDRKISFREFNQKQKYKIVKENSKAKEGELQMVVESKE